MLVAQNYQFYSSIDFKLFKLSLGKLTIPKCNYVCKTIQVPGTCAKERRSEENIEETAKRSEQELLRLIEEFNNITHRVCQTDKVTF